MIKFNFPDFIEGQLAYESYCYLKHNHPEMFYDDVTISSIFGTFPNCVWNGGSVFIGGATYSYDFMKNHIEWYNERNIAIRLLATNPLVEEHHFYDNYANIIMKAANNGYNEVVVCNEKLEEYLRSKYPNFKYVKSIIASYENNQVVDLDDKYYMSCLMRSANNNWKFLDSIPLEQRHKVEFLCTDPCPNNCPRIKTHYHSMAKQHLEMSITNDNHCSMEKIKSENLAWNYTNGLDCAIDYKKIITEYVPRGFTNFKISGRFNFGAITTSIANYLIKPEYHSDWYCNILNRLCKRKYSGWVGVIENDA